MAGHFFVQSILFLRIYVLKELRRAAGACHGIAALSRDALRRQARPQPARFCPALSGPVRPCAQPCARPCAQTCARSAPEPGHPRADQSPPRARPESAPRRRPHVQAATETFLLSIRSRQTESRITPGQIHFEMLNISRFSLSRKCDFRPNPRHAVARCAFVQH